MAESAGVLKGGVAGAVATQLTSVAKDFSFFFPENEVLARLPRSLLLFTALQQAKTAASFLGGV
jgi:hypothetical protein